jgi:signal transduction histidine kinase/ligand-binding sensor domain-containing protein/CheY-like chemotaxis protein
MLFRIFVLFVTLIQASAQAETKADIFDMGERYFQTVGNEESIPLGIITALTQDSQGFLWIGTQKGLVRYDGYRFRLFQYDKNNNHSLGGNLIGRLWAAPDGKLWVGTIHSGLSVLDPNTEKFKRYQYTASAAQQISDNQSSDSHPSDNQISDNQISDNYITAILGDKKGAIWVGTKQGLDKLNPLTGQIIHYRHSDNNPNSLLSNQVGALLIDSEDTLWVGTSKGLNKLLANHRDFEPIFSDKNKNNSLYGDPISKLLLAKDGKIWIGTSASGAAWIGSDKRLHRLKSDNTRSDRLNHPVIVDIAQPDEKEIWLATYGGGINIIDAVSGKILSHVQHDISVASSLNLNNLGALWVDQSGLLWLGTWGGGLNSFNPKNTAFRTLRHSPIKKTSLSWDDILSVLEVSNGDIWIGTRGKGIDIFRPEVGIIKTLRLNRDQSSAPKNGSISALHQTTNGTIWVGSRQSGLFRYRPESDDFESYTKDKGLASNQIKRLLEGKNGELWIGTVLGLDRLIPETGIIDHFVTKNSSHKTLQSWLNSLAILKDGTLFAGASNGLYRLKPGEKYLSIATHNPLIPSSLSHNTVVGLFVNRQQQLMVSTQQGLDQLVHWDGENSQFESINARLGYPGQALWANLQTDQQERIWDGKSIINLEINHRRELTKADDIDIGVNWYSGYTKTQSGTLLYAGSKGLLMVKPERFQEWHYQPPVVISQLMINGKIQPPGKMQQLTLNADMKSFNLEFSALDFSDPLKNQYAYRLEGYDPDWKYTSADNRNASYTNLSPGNYRLHIKGSNRLGLWSDKKINLAITILPKWFQTIWFKLLSLILTAALLYLVYFLRVRQLYQKKKELRMHVAQRTLELEQSNKNISTLSDIGKKISSTLDLDKILKTVYFHVNQMMDANVFCIGFYEEENDNILFKLLMERGKQLPEFSIAMSEKGRLAVYCIEKQQPIIINDFERDKPHYFDNVTYLAPKSGEETASAIYWPLVIGGKTIGTISVQSFEKNAYSQHQQKIIQTLASTTAIALDHANAYMQAQHTAESKSMFLANMSHEIRTPMHGILGMTKLLSQTEIDLEQKKYIKNIDISANTLLTVINDILDFSKIEAGKMPLVEKPFGLTQLLNNISIIVDTIAQAKGLKFDYLISPETPGDLIGDPSRINQILLNLCSNAVKFTEQGTILVKIKTIDIKSSTYTLQISVTDQGIGIPPAAISKLFHSFSQAGSSTARKYGGTGLGLAISRLLAREMHGDITVKSTQGVGSCFTLIIKLPRYTPDINDRHQKLANHCKLLIIDQNVLSSTKIKKQLACLGAQSTAVHDKKELLEIASKTQPCFDLALLSWSQDSAINSELLQILKKDFQLPEKNTIIYSKYKITSIIQSASKLDIENIMQKPLSVLELKQLITDNARGFENRTKRQDKPLDSIKILVAEDNEINQIIARKLLTSKGATVEMVENGKQAVEKVEKNDYDIILMDIQMPEMDGTVASKIIRQNVKNNDLPIIAITANVLESDVEAYKNYGINDHVSKPIDTQDLITKILKHIKS